MESFENIKNKVIRDTKGDIISANGFDKGEYVVFDRNLGAYSDAMFKIKKYFELNSRAYIDYGFGTQPIDDFFFRGYRKPTQEEIDDFKNN